MSKKHAFAPVHPGDILRETLEEFGVSQYRFAKITGIDRPLLNGICKGSRRITAGNALRIARALGTDAQSWLNMQTKYDLWRAEADAEKFAAIEPFPATTAS